jgi:hypothetical protein
MAVRVNSWKMHIGYRAHGQWFDEKTYPAVPSVFNLLMDPMEQMDPYLNLILGASSSPRRCGFRRPLRRSWPRA